MNAVVREIALDFAEGKYRVDFIEHLAGNLNTMADALSRLFQPGTQKLIPAELLLHLRAAPPVRESAWWETMGSPE